MSQPGPGPASYFPSIEKKYGRPISEWMRLIRSSELTKHKPLVDWLKAQYGVGRGQYPARFTLVHPRPVVAGTSASGHREPRDRAGTHAAGFKPQIRGRRR